MKNSSWKGVIQLFYELSYLISILVICAFWLNYKKINSPRFEIDTNYLRWTSKLPAISVCQADEFARSTLLNNDDNDLILRKFILELIRPGKDVCTGCDKLTVLKNKELIIDFDRFVIQSVASCPNLFDQCSWNGKKFDCCQRFKQLKTKGGICYSVNSQMTEYEDQLSVSHFAKDAVLLVAVKHPIQVFIHDPKDVLFITNKIPVLIQGSVLNVSISSREVIVDQSAWSLTIQQRGCILPDERPLKCHQTYSQSACQVECQVVNQVKLCDCFHHLLPKVVENKKPCNLSGLQCINYNFNNPDQVKRKKVSKLVRKCNCLPSCEETEFKVVRSRIINTNLTGIKVHIEQLFPPTERLILKARVEFFDVLVGFACVSRLVSDISLLDVARTVLRWIYSYKSVCSYRDILY